MKLNLSYKQTKVIAILAMLLGPALWGLAFLNYPKETIGITLLIAFFIILNWWLGGDTPCRGCKKWFPSSKINAQKYCKGCAKYDRDY